MLSVLPIQNVAELNAWVVPQVLLQTSEYLKRDGSVSPCASLD